AVRAAGGHHQPERDVAGGEHRDGGVGGGGRARHAGRPHRRRLLRQRREELVHAGLPRVLALLPRRAVHRGDAVPAAGHRRPAARPREGAARMTPDLMEAGARARQDHDRNGQRRTESGGRAASYGRLVSPGTLDVAHGAILYLDDITVSFDGFKALNALSLSISAGELRCIIGPNGAGKTTMMDVITGKTRPDAGAAFFGSTIDLLRLR